MPDNPPKDFPRIAPILFYADPAGALDWLAKKFGFEKRMAMPGPDGKIMHAEMQVADSVIMMGPASETDEQKSPKALGGSVTQSLYVYVDDVDGHHARAKSAGASIASGPEDMFWGDRIYTATDLEGHRWTFAEHTREIAPEDMKPPA